MVVVNDVPKPPRKPRKKAAPKPKPEITIDDVAAISEYAKGPSPIPRSYDIISSDSIHKMIQFEVDQHDELVQHDLRELEERIINRVADMVNDVLGKIVEEVVIDKIQDMIHTHERTMHPAPPPTDNKWWLNPSCTTTVQSNKR